MSDISATNLFASLAIDENAMDDSASEFDADEFNNVPNATTGVSPFFANKGYHPNITVYPECNLASARACQFAVDLNNLQATLKSEIAEAQQRYQQSADAHHLPAPDFQVSQKVFVKAKYFRTTCPSKKLSEKYLSPYKIIAQPGSHSFTLQLPESMCAVHPIFHISMLEPSTPNPFPTHSALPPAPVVIDGEPEFEIACVVNSKINWHRACKLLYKVIWLGYKDTEDKSSWLPATKLEHAPELVSDFHAAYPHKPGPLPSL
ncbi:hypothetical protein AN958_02751 [Leucoagaricus sp. SymC.cos]|nr:hypothetical protein AN958_02751 [Leucoagaricus sp. SymC.cos]